MRLCATGSTSPIVKREKTDLGRFGLGLKTASWSQCKYMIVATKKSRKTSTKFWDLDYVDKSKKWSLGNTPEKKYIKLIKPLEKVTSGTIVIWTKLDRFIDSCKTETFDREKHFLVSS